MLSEDEVESASEKEYDSDKDPGWKPCVDVNYITPRFTRLHLKYNCMH